MTASPVLTTVAVFAGLLRSSWNAVTFLDLSHLFWSAGCSDDDVTAFDQFLENDATCLTCGSVENDFQLDCSLYGTAGCSEVEQNLSTSTLWRKSSKGRRCSSLRLTKPRTISQH